MGPYIIVSATGPPKRLRAWKESAVGHFPELSVLHEPPAHESWKERPSHEICGVSSPS